MVPANSQQIPRARCYSRTPPQDTMFSPTRLSRPTVQYSKLIRLTQNFITPRPASRPDKMRLTTPHTQPLPGLPCARFSLLRFRSPLLTESRLFSLPVGTEMFHFPTFPLPALYIQAGVTGSARRPAGFPHSETLGSKCAYPLPEAYRRLLRPSSAPDAKASTVCS